MMMSFVAGGPWGATVGASPPAQARGGPSEAEGGGRGDRVEPSLHRLGPVVLPQLLPGRGEVRAAGAGGSRRDLLMVLCSLVPRPSTSANGGKPGYEARSWPQAFSPPPCVTSKTVCPGSARTCLRTLLAENPPTPPCRR